MNYRGIDPIKTLRQLNEIEHKCGILDGKSGKKRIAYFNGQGWIYLQTNLQRFTSIKYWVMLFKLALKSIVKKGSRNNMNNLRSALYICSSRVQASRVRLRNNIIAFYPERGVVCKFVRDNPKRNSQCLRNECNTLKKLQDFGGLPVPRVHSYVETPVQALFMDHVGNRQVSMEEVQSVSEHIIERIVKWYEFYGIRFLSANEHPIIKRFLMDKNEYFRCGWNESEVTVIKEVLDFVGSLSIGISRIHGDLYPSNIMINPEGGVVVIDWELSRDDMVAIDFNALCTVSPHVEEMWRKWRVSIGNSKMQVCPDAELHLAYIVRNHDLSRLTDSAQIRKNVLAACYSINHLIRPDN